MYSLVYLQLLAEEKSLVTDGTLEWFFSAVPKTVLTKRALIDERVAADITGIRAFSGMKADMTEQVTPGGELPTARFAIKRRVASVTVAVHSQMGCTAERFAAHRAHEWLVVAVKSLVPDEVIVRGEAATTYGTCERPLSVVDVHVALQVGGR